MWFAIIIITIIIGINTYVCTYDMLGALFVCIAIITYIQRICNYANTCYIRYVHMCNTIIKLQEI